MDKATTTLSNGKETENEKDIRNNNVDIIQVPVCFNPNPTFSNTLKPFFKELTDEQIRNALIKYTKNHILPSSSKAKELNIINTEYSFAHIYKLISFNQRREFKEKFTRYKAGRLDDTSFGPIPDLFEITPNSIPDFFTDFNEKVYVPHSEKVKKCNSCGGSGTETTTTTSTNSDGSTSTSTIVSSCSRCGGNGQLKYYLICKIKWETQLDVFVSYNEPKLCKKKIKKSKGINIFSNSDVKVLPVNYLSDQELTMASKRIVERSHTLHNEKCISIQQRQKIKVIPIVACHYFRSKPKTFWIYGEDLNVYAPDFPNDISCSLM